MPKNQVIYIPTSISIERLNTFQLILNFNPKFIDSNEVTCWLGSKLTEMETIPDEVGFTFGKYVGKLVQKKIMDIDIRIEKELNCSLISLEEIAKSKINLGDRDKFFDYFFKCILDRNSFKNINAAILFKFFLLDTKLIFNNWLIYNWDNNTFTHLYDKETWLMKHELAYKPKTKKEELSKLKEKWELNKDFRIPYPD